MVVMPMRISTIAIAVLVCTVSMSGLAVAGEGSETGPGDCLSSPENVEHCETVQGVDACAEHLQRGGDPATCVDEICPYRSYVDDQQDPATQCYSYACETAWETYQTEAADDEEHIIFLYPDCVAVACFVLIDQGEQVTGESDTWTCTGYTCEQLRGLADGVDCGETMCREIPRVVDTVRVATDDAEEALLGLVPGEVEPVLQRVVVNPGVTCDPGGGSGAGSGCQTVARSNSARAGAGVRIYHGTEDGTLQATHCAWAESWTAGYQWVSEDGRADLHEDGCTLDEAAQIYTGANWNTPATTVRC